MSRSIKLLAFLCLLSPAIFAQEKVISNSPCINLTATPAVLQAGEITIVTATTPINQNASYQWKVKSGEIIKGQDTNKIEVRAFAPRTAFSVKVKAKEGKTFCASSISVEVVGCGLPMEIDRFGKLSLDAEKARLDNVGYTFAKAEPNNQILIVAQFDKNVGEKNLVSRLARAKDFLIKQHQIDSGKILLFLSESDYADLDYDSIVIYIMPKDVPFLPSDYKIVTDEMISELSKKGSSNKRKKN